MNSAAGQSMQGMQGMQGTQASGRLATAAHASGPAVAAPQDRARSDSHTGTGGMSGHRRADGRGWGRDGKTEEEEEVIGWTSLGPAMDAEECEEAAAALGQAETAASRGGAGGRRATRGIEETRGERGAADILTLGSDCDDDAQDSDEDEDEKEGGESEAEDVLLSFVEPQIRVHVVDKGAKATQPPAARDAKAGARSLRASQTRKSAERPTLRDAPREDDRGGTEGIQDTHVAQPPHARTRRGAPDQQAARGTECADDVTVEHSRKRPAVACQTSVLWSELVCRVQVAREKQRGVVLAAALDVGVVQREVEEAQRLVSHLSTALTTLLPSQHEELVRAQVRESQAQEELTRTARALDEEKRKNAEISARITDMSARMASTEKQLLDSREVPAELHAQLLELKSQIAEKEREHASGEVRKEALLLQHAAVLHGMQKEVDRLEEALRWAKNVADASVLREQSALSRLEERERELSKAHTLLAQNNLQVEEGKKRELLADHQAAHVVGELRSVAHQLASLQAHTVDLATKARECEASQRLLQQMQIACTESSARVAALTSARESSDEMLRKSEEELKSARTQVRALQEELREQHDKASSGALVQKMEAEQAIVQQQLETALQEAQKESEGAKKGWKAAEEREARAATVVAELTKLVKDQRAKLVDASRDSKQTEKELRSALQEALDEIQGLHRRLRAASRLEKTASDLERDLDQERKVAEELRRELEEQGRANEDAEREIDRQIFLKKPLYSNCI